MSDVDVIRNYHVHGECGRFHSEIRIDMDAERILSGKIWNKRACVGADSTRLKHSTDWTGE